MRIQDLDFEDKRDWLKITDLENAFSVYLSSKGKYDYNLNQTTYFNVNEDVIKTYVCTTDEHWPLISYKLYNTTRLAWLLMKMNQVDAVHMFDVKHAGDQIKYVEVNLAQTVVSDINLTES